jgi:catalase
VQMPTHELWTGHVTAFSTTVTDKDFEQARKLWHIISDEPNGKEQLLHNIIPTIKDIPEKLQQEVLSMLTVKNPNRGLQLNRC